MATSPGRALVVLDHLAPDGGAFLHGLDWARQLGLPVCGLSIDSQTGQEQEGCAVACTQLGLSWARLDLSANGTAGLQQLAGPQDFLIFSQGLPPDQKRDILHATSRGPAPAILVCPDHWTPLSRILLLDQGDPINGRFLAAATEVRRRFRARLIVLSIARSERTAKLRQHAVHEALAECGPDRDLDFDMVVGSNVRQAVIGVARWRQCTLVVMPRSHSTPWWRWLRGSSTEHLMQRTASLAFLALPDRYKACG